MLTVLNKELPLGMINKSILVTDLKAVKLTLQ